MSENPLGITSGADVSHISKLPEGEPGSITDRVSQAAGRAPLANAAAELQMPPATVQSLKELKQAQALIDQLPDFGRLLADMTTTLAELERHSTTVGETQLP